MFDKNRNGPSTDPGGCLNRTSCYYSEEVEPSRTTFLLHTFEIHFLMKQYIYIYNVIL